MASRPRQTRRLTNPKNRKPAAPEKVDPLVARKRRVTAALKQIGHDFIERPENCPPPAQRPDSPKGMTNATGLQGLREKDERRKAKEKEMRAQMAGHNLNPYAVGPYQGREGDLGNTWAMEGRNLLDALSESPAVGAVLVPTRHEIEKQQQLVRFERVDKPWKRQHQHQHQHQPPRPVTAPAAAGRPAGGGGGLGPLTIDTVAIERDAPGGFQPYSSPAGRRVHDHRPPTPLPLLRARALPTSPLARLPPLRLFRDGAMEAPPTSVLDEICRKLESEQRHPHTSMALVLWWWRVRVPLTTFGALIAHARTNVQLRNREKTGKPPPPSVGDAEGAEGKGKGKGGGGGPPFTKAETDRAGASENFYGDGELGELPLPLDEAGSWMAAAFPGRPPEANTLGALRNAQKPVS